MGELKTPYLDKEIRVGETLKFLSSESKSRLQEYQQIKQAVKRLGELEEAAKQSVELMESGSPENWLEAIENLKTVLEK